MMVPGEGLDPPSPVPLLATEDKTLMALALALRSAVPRARRRGPGVFKTTDYWVSPSTYCFVPECC